MNIQRIGVRVCLLIGLLQAHALCHASSLVQSHDEVCQLRSAQWNSLSSELLIVADPSQFMHISIDRRSLLHTYAVPLRVLAEATTVKARVIGYDAHGQIIQNLEFSGTTETPGFPAGIGTTIYGSDLEYVYIIIEVSAGNGGLGLPGSGGGGKEGVIGPVPGSGSDECCGSLDINCDGVVDEEDFEQLLDLILNGDPVGDLNGDGCAGAADLEILLELFGPLFDPNFGGTEDPFNPYPHGPNNPIGPNGICNPVYSNLDEEPPYIDIDPDEDIYIGSDG